MENYEAFENAFRGSPALIRDRLKTYEPLINQLLKESAQNVRALDLGCGRGEWLELCKIWGIDAVGVDNDPSMIKALEVQNFNISPTDALAHLRKTKTESVTLITSFHMVEHLDVSLLEELLAEINRVLVDDGLLIIETPNVDNLVVGTNSFFLDPTHLRPVPAAYLEFLCSNAGFTQVKKIGLHSSLAPEESTSPSLWQVLSGASQDYAMVCSRSSTINFDTNLPLAQSQTLHDLANNFGSPAELRDQLAPAVTSLTHRLTAVETEQELLKEITALHVAEIRTLATFCDDVKANQQEMFRLTERISALTSQLLSMQRSKSWLLTTPLRWLGSFIRNAGLASVRLLSPVSAYLIRHPKLLSRLVVMVMHYPRLATLSAFVFTQAQKPHLRNEIHSENTSQHNKSYSEYTTRIHQLLTDESSNS